MLPIQINQRIYKYILGESHPSSFVLYNHDRHTDLVKDDLFSLGPCLVNIQKCTMNTIKKDMKFAKYSFFSHFSHSGQR